MTAAPIRHAMCLILLAIELAACTTPAEGPPPAPTIVQIPIPASCVRSDFPGAPNYPDTREALKAAPDWAARDQLLRAGWDMRDSRLAVLEQQLAACR